MSQRLIHYSKDPLVTVYSVAQQSDYFKPMGLWVSVEGEHDWKSWCEGEGFMLDRFVHEQEIVLSDDANILRITDAIGIDLLSERYRLDGRHSRYQLNWKTIASQFDGIIIAPYIWSWRMTEHSPWYYTWDCASGCIWNSDAIKEIVPLNMESAASRAEFGGARCTEGVPR